MLRRQFLFNSLAVPALFGATATELSHRKRVDAALAGTALDRPPFTFWHHFGLKTPEDHAKATLDFHRNYRTDIVKVMSDFPYPKPSGKWYEPKVASNPFPDQLRALQLIRDGLDGNAYFIETIFNPWNVAEKLSSRDEVLRFKEEKPQALLDALDVITKSEINHARLALKEGAAGLLLSVANANSKELSQEDYRKFSEPFDRRILEATSSARLNILHLHVEPQYLGFFRGFQAPIINYSRHVSGIPVADVRKLFPSVIAGGIDEVNYRKLSPEQLREQWREASLAAGNKFILTPGCSVPNETTPAELSRLPGLLHA
jgi:uroporphyrinogen decarboxylase